ncbi:MULTISPECIES: hypothetical protein [unclassified Arcicella]|uniref:hypothetical protein n=1 Tax=unclassified Arcicella TaxID=2644986 RepID=UPI002860BB18|nr:MULTISPECIES: hypothetical protein [unclassified Arcicella]MDR6563554.1 hypothetical protein [Arcicella sp. BE51]MDR6813334.1 hypothetical protein [Arcicella sp. BE140]MDR6824647.1 hypothetical protein [Arcicella sp. BE139]
MEKEFYYMDEFNVKTVFHHQLYLDYLCKCVKDILKKDVDTKVYEHWASWFSTLKDYDDVYIIMHEGSEYLAVILSGGGESDEYGKLTKKQKEEFTSLMRNYLKEKGISSFIEKI